MNEGWLNYTVEYVILPDGRLGLVTDRREDRTAVRVMPDDSDGYTASWPSDRLRTATTLEVYEHGEARLKQQPLGPGYGANAHKTMWDLMSERDRDYWRSLRPAEGTAS